MGVSPPRSSLDDVSQEAVVQSVATNGPSMRMMSARPSTGLRADPEHPRDRRSAERRSELLDPSLVIGVCSEDLVDHLPRVPGGSLVAHFE